MAAPQPICITCILTCFNRKSLTLACLDALATCAQEAGVALRVILVDDASTDGTASAVRERFPWVEVVLGAGDLFWCRGMHAGFALALQRPADYYMWINDDTLLLPGALSSMLRQSADLERRDGKPVILVGATADRVSGAISYGGRVAHSRWRRFNYRLVWHPDQAVPCEAIEGNCVLIPRQLAEQVGNLDPAFEHAMGDTDYGLRARRAGFAAYVAAGVAGHCSANPIRGTYQDASLPLARRWRLVRSRKGLPPRSWLHFTRRHGGVLWPMYFAWPYIKVLLSAFRASPSGSPPPIGGADKAVQSAMKRRSTAAD